MIRSRLTALVALTLGCSSSRCDTPYPATASGAEIRNNAVAMRVSNDLFTFAKNSLAGVITSKFGKEMDGTTLIALEDQGIAFRVNAEEFASHIIFGMEAPTLFEVGGLRFRLDDLTVGLEITFKGDTPFGDLGDARCKAAGTVAINALDIVMKPRVVRGDVDDKPYLNANTAVRELDLASLSLRATSLVDPPAEECAELDQSLQDLQNAFQLLGPLLNAIFPTLATTIGNTLLGLVWSSELEMSAMIPVSTLPFIADGIGNDVNFMLTTQEDAFSITQIGAGQNDKTLGMNLPFAMGVYSDRSPCVPPLPPNPYDPSVHQPKLDGLYTRIDPVSGALSDQPYHVGVLISGDYVNHMAQTFRSSGLLCASVGSSLLEATNYVPTAGLLYLIAPELSALAPSDSPIRFRTVPLQAPKITFGSGRQMGVDANNKPIIDSAMTLALQQVRVEFDLLAWGRFVRAFSILVDLRAGVSLIPMSNGRLQVAVDTIKIDGIHSVDNPLELQAYQFTKLAEVVFAIVSSQLGSSGLTFDVPLQQTLQEAIGGTVSARVLDVRAEGDEKQFLGAYFKLCSTSVNDPTDVGCYVPPAPPARETTAAIASDVEDGAVTINAPAGYEYQVAVDGDMYGRFYAPPVRVESALLRLLGDHTLKVRSRVKGAPLDVRAAVQTLTVTTPQSLQPVPPPVGAPTPVAPRGCANVAGWWFVIAIVAALRRVRVQA